MKKLLIIISCGLLLSACGAAHGLRKDLPKLSSRTPKSPSVYLECVRPKWAASAQVRASIRKTQGTLSARDKSGAHELLTATPDAAGALVRMYERQNAKKAYNPAYRDAAVSCL